MRAQRALCVWAATGLLSSFSSFSSSSIFPSSSSTPKTRAGSQDMNDEDVVKTIMMMYTGTVAGKTLTQARGTAA
eukprot:CAMPEP_0173099434 /NCGR_PEP_ID=MMETSP1102-20130122/35490_1 /TAXON_ID=49646 /ORGANISM="Geminigera sp., Strain Caron Lab Isolate" /LENGTH=74 /DNA_ID=CAMNT_0013992453 /DNA_START=569 /DNA_END=789 /DNA_ORIENTATION=-